MMAPKTSKSQVGADFCWGWGNCHMDKECTVLFSSAQTQIVTAQSQPPPQSTSTQVGSDKLIAHPN
jgi:hypothetical protein